MDSSWLGLDDFFSSSRLSSRISLATSDFGLGPRDLTFDTTTLRDSLLREFDDFPRRTGSRLKTKSGPFTTRRERKEEAKKEELKKEEAAEGARTDADVGNVRELRLKLQHCQEEICKLQAVITELTQVNKRWQKYNSDRQIYVQKLLNTIQDQQEQLNLIGEHSFTTSAPPSQQTSSVLESSIDSEKEKRQIVEKKLKEKVSILEFQVKAHRDDWEAELNEKKQALRDKEAVEQRVVELMRELETVTGRAEHGYSEESLGRVELFCQNCGRVSDFEDLPPSRSRIYRTAVHLPCSSSSQHSSTTSILTSDELVIDNVKGLDHQYESDSKDSTRTWNIKCDENSYSRSSTFPLVGEIVQSKPASVATTTHSSTSSVNDKTFQLSCNPVTVKSFVQIPIAKSSSVPEGSLTKFTDLTRMSLDSFEISSHVPPVSVVHSSDQYSGTETNTAENVICLRCGEVFPPEKHLKFLDHFPKCQSNRSAKLVSRDGVRKE